MKISTDEERLSPDYSFIYLSTTLSPKDSDAEKFLLANREKLNTTIGMDKIDKRLSENLQRELMRSLGREGDKVDVKRLDTIAKEIKTLNLSNEKSLLALQNIAKTVKGGNINHILSICEKELPKVENNQFLSYSRNNAFRDATKDQKLRWEEIKKKTIK